MSTSERVEGGVSLAVEAIKHNPGLWPRRIPAKFRMALPVVYAAVSRNPASAYPKVDLSVRSTQLNLAKIAVIGDSPTSMTTAILHFPSAIIQNPEFYVFAINYWAGRNSQNDVNTLFDLCPAAKLDVELVLKHVGHADSIMIA